MKQIPDLAEKKDRLPKKFNNLITPILGAQKTKALSDAVLSVASCDDIGKLLQLAAT